MHSRSDRVYMGIAALSLVLAAVASPCCGASLARSDDGFEAAHLTTPFTFFQRQYSSVYVSILREIENDCNGDPYTPHVYLQNRSLA